MAGVRRRAPLTLLQKIVQQDLHLDVAHREDMGSSNEREFYETRSIFERHNFARDVRRNVREQDWILLKTKYYLTAAGIVQFAFRKNVTNVVDCILRGLQQPWLPEVDSRYVLERRPTLPPPSSDFPFQAERRDFVQDKFLEFDEFRPSRDFGVDYRLSETFHMSLVPSLHSSLSSSLPYPRLPSPLPSALPSPSPLAERAEPFVRDTVRDVPLAPRWGASPRGSWSLSTSVSTRDDAVLPPLLPPPWDRKRGADTPAPAPAPKRARVE